MSAGLRGHLRPFIPPILVDLVRRVARRPNTFSGDYASWDAALAEATGYDAHDILDRVIRATRKVVAGQAVYERDSVVFDQIEYSWPLLASLLQVGLECKSLRVIDFGGSLGSTWRQNRKYLGRLHIPQSWCVVEQENFVAAGRAEFATDQLHFEPTIQSAARRGVDAVLFLSSLCYVADPRDFLQEATATEARFLIVDRLAVIAGDRDRIAVQRVAEPIYPASYPIRFFAEQQLLDNWFGDWRLIESWDCDLQPDPESRCRGFFLERR